MPAQIDYILICTNNEKLTYIGHSQGTTQIYSNLADTQNRSVCVADEINLFVNLAPITKIGDHKENGKFRAMAHTVPSILKATE